MPGPPADTWPVFQHEAVRSHAETFPSRADEYGSGIRAKLEAASRVDTDAVTDGYRALLAWRRLVPEVDLYVSPCVAIDWPREDADELDVPAAALVVPAVGQPARVGGAGGRQPPLRRAARRDRPRCGAGVGARVGLTCGTLRHKESIIGHQS